MPDSPSTHQGSRATVLHVVDSLERGGLERLVNDLAIAQQASGMKTLVFSINTTGGYIDDLRRAGVPVHEGHKRGTLDMRVLRALRRIIQTEHVTVVHAHNFVPSYYAVMATLAMRRRPAHVVTCHDMGTRLSNRRLRHLFSWSVRHTQVVTMVGQQVFQHMTGSGLVAARKAETVINAVPVERFGLTPARRLAARQQLGLTNDDLVLGCVGRLVELKNHLALIEALPTLLPRHPTLKLLLLGDGPLKDDLTRRAAELKLTRSVNLAGLQKNIPDLLPAMDVFALPSLTEGVSIALLEACATGLPCLASRVGGNPEVIQDGQRGLLFNVQDAADLKAKLCALLDSPALRQQYGQAAQDWVHAHASLSSLRQRYDEIYELARQRRFGRAPAAQKDQA